MSIIQSIINFLRNFFSKDKPPEPPSPPTEPPNPPVNNTNTLVLSLLDAHNSYRHTDGVKALVLRESLNLAAQKHAQWMASNRSMSHEEYLNSLNYDASDFVSRIKKENYKPITCAENIAAGQMTVNEVMHAWTNSPGHQANIVNDDYWDVGFGISQDMYGHIYWCAVFAAPARLSIRHILLKVNLPRALVKR